MIYRRLKKNDRQTKLADDSEIRTEVFRILQKFGPRDESEIACKELNNKGQVSLIVKSLLVVVPLVRSRVGLFCSCQESIYGLMECVGSWQWCHRHYLWIIALSCSHCLACVQDSRPAEHSQAGCFWGQVVDWCTRRLSGWACCLSFNKPATLFSTS